MIVIWVDMEDMEVVMDGHANAERNEEGHDLVCAAASHAVQAFAYGAQRYGGVEKDFASGHARVKIVPQENRVIEDAKRLMYYLLDSLHLLEHRYPDCIQVINL